MKTFVYRRHSLKLGERISLEGLRLATKLGRADTNNFDFIVGGPMPRTWETVAAFMAGAEHKMTVLPMVKEFGDEELIADWIKRGFLDAVKDMGTNINGLRKILAPDEFESTKKVALAGVVDVFDSIENGQSAIGFGHSPLIECAAEATGFTSDTQVQLRELEGLKFVLRDDHNIFVTETLTL